VTKSRPRRCPRLPYWELVREFFDPITQRINCSLRNLKLTERSNSPPQALSMQTGMTPENAPPPDKKRRHSKLRSIMIAVTFFCLAMGLRTVLQGRSILEIPIFLIPFTFCWMAAFGILSYDIFRSSTSVWLGMFFGFFLCFATLVAFPEWIYPQLD